MEKRKKILSQYNGEYKLNEIISLVDEEPILNEEMLKELWWDENTPDSIRGEEVLQRNFGELNSDIANFYLTLSEKLPYAVPNFLDKLSSLEIYVSRDEYDEHTGKYFSDNNVLLVYLPKTGKYELSPAFRETLYHELLHMTSSYISKEKEVSGFLTEIKTPFSRTEIGSLLNEEYLRQVHEINEGCWSMIKPVSIIEPNLLTLKKFLLLP